LNIPNVAEEKYGCEYIIKQMVMVLLLISLSSIIFKCSFYAQKKNQSFMEVLNDNFEWSCYGICTQIKILSYYIMEIFSNVLDIWDLLITLIDEIEQNWIKRLLISITNNHKSRHSKFFFFSIFF
jgi:hypothetical protein